MGHAQGEEIVTKGEFAVLCKVSPGRVTQWIGDGKISPAALVGEGRSAKIRVAQAQADLKRSLDPNQMSGNGIRTRIPGGPLVPSPQAIPASTSEPTARPASSEPLPFEGLSGAALDLPSERAALTREQRLNWEIRNAERRGELIDAIEAEHRWADAVVALRSRMLAIAGDLPLTLSHLTANDIAVIDRAIRNAMDLAAGGGA